MKMSQLVRYNVPPEIIGLWQEQESDKLLPLQELAIKRHGLFEGGNLLIQAPTSSGKTFVGEMAAIQTAMRRKKAVYLVPLKALAEEKYADFKCKYEPYGVKVIVSTRNRREFDGDLEDGNFSIAVVVYEKLSQLLVRRPERLAEIELIIADELEILSDPERGAMAEVLLTRILQSQNHQGPARGQCRLIGLSAVIGEPEKLAQWMKAQLVFYERRPVELRYGVLHEGMFKYRTYNEYSESEEQLIEGHSESRWEMVTENICEFTARGESCLVFVKAKEESRRGAELLARRMELAPATQALRSLEKLEGTRSREYLLETLTRGVAFHNADLSPEERLVVEQAFRDGEVKVMVSTTTLAVGLNLPAQNVFISTDKWQYDKRFGMPWKTPILRAEYENMGGRAGRYGAGQEFGRSILVAATPFELETYWRRYVEGERECIEPQLHKEPLDNHILHLVASRFCRTEDEALSFLENTLSGQWEWLETLTIQELEFRIHAAINRVIDDGMITTNEDGKLEATPLGQAVSVKGISINTAKELEAWIGESETRLWSNLDLILAAALSEDGRMFYATLTAREYEHADYPAMLKRITDGEDLAADVPMNRLRNCNLTPFYGEVRAIKVALLMAEWIDHIPLRELEEHFQTMTGQILAAADQISWIIDAAGSIATALGAGQSFVRRIATLAERVHQGLHEEVLPLARLTIPTLNRQAIVALNANQLHTPEILANTSPSILTKYLDNKHTNQLIEWAQNQETATPNKATSKTPPSSQPVLIVDDRHPGSIVVDGASVRLQEKQYRLIRVLAASPGECVPYDTIYEAVWGDTIVEPNQMHFQKRKLLDHIKTAAPHQDKLISTVPKRGFTLNLSEEEVLFHQAEATIGNKDESAPSALSACV